MAADGSFAFSSGVREPMGEGIPISFHDRKVRSVVTEEVPQQGTDQDQTPEKGEETARPDKDKGGDFLCFRFLLRFLGKLFFAP